MTKSKRQVGTIKWFDNAKGFGFISGEDGADIFVHFRSIQQDEGYRSLSKDQVVEYSLVEDEKGLSAEDVIILHHEEQ